MSIKIGVTDDQQLFLRSLCTLINTLEPFEVIVDAMNGEELLQKLARAGVLPDILLIDVNMPVMDGVKAAQIITEKYPSIKMAALSMNDDDGVIINMIKAGCCAYLLKGIHPDELQKALMEIHTKGFYNADASNINYRRLLVHSRNEAASALNDREKTFLQLACSDLTYKQIAAQMYLSERTIDGYRESIFEKLNVQSRVGMVLEGLRRQLITL